MPALSSLSALAELLDCTVDDLTTWLAPGRRGYERHLIYRGPDPRVLMEPLPGLKALQVRLLYRLLYTLPAHPAATAYVRGSSVVDNAAAHVGKDFVFACDLTGFFDSVTGAQVREVFARQGAADEVADALTTLLTCRLPGSDHRSLPQGSPTSAYLANLVCVDLDQSLTEFAQARRYAYTRYSDDIAISGHGWIAEADVATVRERIESFGFQLNPRKTRIVRRRRQQKVTGLVVNDQVGITRQRLKELRALFHRASLDLEYGEQVFDYLSGVAGWLTHVYPDPEERPSAVRNCLHHRDELLKRLREVRKQRAKARLSEVRAAAGAAKVVAPRKSAADRVAVTRTVELVPVAPEPDIATRLPAAMLAAPRWVLWLPMLTSGGRAGKVTKKPVGRSGESPGWNLPGNWMTFDEAWERFQTDPARYGGLGFVLAPDDAPDWVGIDVDDCLDPATGELNAWAREIVSEFPTYAEVSPSGRGIKLFGLGAWPGGRGIHRRAGLELHAARGFFTVTGHRLEGTPAEATDLSAALQEHFARTDGQPPA